jgi:hypothetical protein
MFFMLNARFRCVIYGLLTGRDERGIFENLTEGVMIKQMWRPAANPLRRCRALPVLLEVINEG